MYYFLASGHDLIHTWIGRSLSVHALQVVVY